MRRWLPIVALAALVATACGSDDDEAAQTTTSTAAAVVTTTALATSTSTSVGGPTTTTRAGATTTTRAGAATTTTASPRPSAAKAVIEPARVAGIGLGANKSQAIAVLGEPTTTGQETDLSGKKYDYLKWQLSGNRGLTLNFRTESATSPLLTDWNANAPGPVTKGGVTVGDGAVKVTAAHGALMTFCCESKVASVVDGGGRMIVVIANDTQKVTQIIGGDPAFWSRSIAD